jgi:addiction module RelE/StbE family toxin
VVSLKWTSNALSDLKNIFDFVALDSKYYASIQIKRIKEKTSILKENPRLGRFVPEINDNNIRELIFGNYRIIYHIIDETRIDILTIYHSARILKSLN